MRNPESGAILAGYRRFSSPQRLTGGARVLGGNTDLRAERIAADLGTGYYVADYLFVFIFAHPNQR